MEHHKDDSYKKNVIHRIKIIQGHLKKIEEMIDEDSYCVDIVHQSRAVQSALKQLDLIIIKDHLNTCVIDQIKNGEAKKTNEELLKLFAYK